MPDRSLVLRRWSAFLGLVFGLALFGLTPAIAQNVNGQTVRMVDYGHGAFVQTGPKRWVEVGKPAGQARFHFEETFRNQHEVKLFDRARSVHISLLLSANNIWYGTDTSAMQVLYQIQTVSDQTRVPGVDVARNDTGQPAKGGNTDTGQQVNGNNVRMVDFGQGAFVQTGPERWIEVGKPDGQARFHFEETFRNEHEVKLFDRARSVHISLLLSANNIWYGTDLNAMRQLYQIQTVSDQTRVPGVDVAQNNPGTQPPVNQPPANQPPANQPPADQAPQPTSVELVNNTGQPVDVIWINGDNRQTIGSLPAGGKTPMSTTVGHIFEFMSGGAVLSRHTATGAPGETFQASSRQAATPTPPVNQPAQPANAGDNNPGRNVTGETVRMVDYGRGAFVQVGPKKWVEVGKPDGQARFEFQETFRNEHEVKLFDQGRSVHISLLLSANNIWYGTDLNAMRKLYQIQTVSDQSRVPGVNVAQIDPGTQPPQNQPTPNQPTPNQPPSNQPPGRQVTGRTAQMVDFGEGAFVQIGPKQWIEIKKPSGKARFTYEEAFRNDNEIRLWDAARSVHISLFFATNQIFYAPDGSELRPLYTIRTASDEPRVPGVTIARNDPGSKPAANPTSKPGAVTNVEVVNNTGQYVELFKINDGQRQRIGGLQAGARSPLSSTTVGHVFEFMSGGRVLSRHTVTGVAGERFLASAQAAARPVAAPGKPSQFPGVTGKSVRMVDYGSGALVQTDPDRWADVLRNSKRPGRFFNETRRGDSWVELFDVAQNRQLVLSLADKQIYERKVGNASKPVQALVGAGNQSRTPGSNTKWDRIQYPGSRKSWKPDKSYKPAFLLVTNPDDRGPFRTVTVKVVISTTQTSDSGQDEVMYTLTDHSGASVRVPSKGTRKMNEDDRNLERWTSYVDVKIYKDRSLENLPLTLFVQEIDTAINDGEVIALMQMPAANTIRNGALSSTKKAGHYKVKVSIADNALHDRYNPEIRDLEKSPQVSNVVAMLNQISGSGSQHKQSPLPGFKKKYDANDGIWKSDHPQGIALTPSGRIALNMSRTNWRRCRPGDREYNSSNPKYMLSDPTEECRVYHEKCGVFLYSESSFRRNPDDMKWTYVDTFRNSSGIQKCLLNKHPSSMQAVGEIVAVANIPVRFVLLPTAGAGFKVLEHLTITRETDSATGDPKKADAVGITYYAKEDRFYAFLSDGAVTNKGDTRSITLWATDPGESLLDHETKFTRMMTIPGVAVSGQGANLIAEEGGDLYVVSTYSTDDQPPIAAVATICSLEYLPLHGVNPVTAGVTGTIQIGAAAIAAAKYPFTDIVIATKIGSYDRATNRLKLKQRGEVVVNRPVGRTQWEQFCVLWRPAFRFAGAVAPISDSEMMTLWSGRYIKLTTPADDQNDYSFLDDYEWSMQRLSN